MVKLTQNGVYLVDGKVSATANISPEEARKNTIAYSILSAHNVGDDKNLKIIKSEEMLLSLRRVYITL